MTGTICVQTSHSLSRSYLNHLVQDRSSRGVTRLRDKESKIGVRLSERSEHSSLPPHRLATGGVVTIYLHLLPRIMNKWSYTSTIRTRLEYSQ